jgi:hypothetical protein
MNIIGSNVDKIIIKHTFDLGMVSIPPIKMVIWRMVYYCFTDIINNMMMFV